MFSFLPPLLIIVGLLGLILLLNKHQWTENHFQRFLSFFKGKKIYQFQSYFLVLTERLLVRFRIMFLKLDQILSSSLSRLRKNRVIQQKEKEGINTSLLSSLNREGEVPTSLRIDFSKEEKKLLRYLEKFPQDKDILLNLARTYLWRGDFSSARGILLRAYKDNKENRIIQSLLIELKEKEGGIQQPREDKPE